HARSVCTARCQCNRLRGVCRRPFQNRRYRTVARYRRPWTKEHGGNPDVIPLFATPMTHTYSHTQLIQFATDLLSAAGLKDDRARVVAETLVESDLMGHTTHGLQLLPLYLKEVRAGKMKWDGEPQVLSDKGSVMVWDGQYL